MIAITDVKKIYDPRGIAGLHSINLTIEEGEVFSIIGPNGSGKSSLLRVICGELKPDQGISVVKGTIQFFRPQAPKTDINVQSYLIQKVAADVDQEKKIQLARDLADLFEFTFQLRQNFSQLSSGQAQKVLVAGELINRADVLLMDEPFAHLDPFTRESILASLFKYLYQQNTTVVWVTHDLDDAFRFSHRTGVMNFGKFEQVSSPRDLLSSPRNLFTAQYLGFKNFLTVKYDEDGWITPWGKVPATKNVANEALLILPKRWEISETGVEMNILHRYPSKSGMIFVVEYLGHEFYGEMDLNSIPDNATRMKVTFKLNQLTVIAL